MAEKVTPIDSKAAAAERARKAVGDKIEAAREKLAGVAEGVEKRLGEAKQEAGKRGQEVRRRAGEASTKAREQYASTVDNLRQGYDKVSRDVVHWSDEVNDYVRANPGKALLISAGVGFVLGLLLKGERDRG